MIRSVAGGIPGAALAFFVFLPSFVFVIGGVHYIEKVRENRGLQAFLAGVSAAVVGVIAVVSLDLIPQALVDWVTVGISLVAFVLIAFLKRDVALVAIGGNHWRSDLLRQSHVRPVAGIPSVR